MELKDFVKFLKKYLMYILVFGVASSALGVLAFYYFPAKYKASGNLFVSRKADEVSAEFFTYEGYYAQQTAHAYANTVGGLLESVDVKKRALESLGIPATEKTLRRLNRLLQVKRPALQIILVEVKGETSVEARNLWISLVKEVISVSKTVDEAGDSSISVLQLNDFPVVQPIYRNVYLFGLVGAGFGLFFGMLASALKEYFG